MSEQSADDLAGEVVRAIDTATREDSATIVMHIGLLAGESTLGAKDLAELLRRTRRAVVETGRCVAPTEVTELYIKSLAMSDDEIIVTFEVKTRPKRKRKAAE